MEFPDDSDPIASQQVESNPFEGRIELLHGMSPQFDCPVFRNKRSAASAIWLKRSAPRRCPSPRAAIASRRSRETNSGPSRCNRSRANPSQNESSSLLDKIGRRRWPPPKLRRDGALSRIDSAAGRPKSLLRAAAEG